MSRHEPDPDHAYDVWREDGERTRLPRLGTPLSPSLIAAEEARRAASPPAQPSYVRGTPLADSPHMQRLRTIAARVLFDDARRR
jgi:hypothetical protein